MIDQYEAKMDAIEDMVAEDVERRELALRDYVRYCYEAMLGSSRPELVYCRECCDFFEWAAEDSPCRDCARADGLKV